MESKYTKDDVIIWPDDPRLKGALDKACYVGESPAEALYVANKAIGQCLLIDINAKALRPFKTSFEGIKGYYPVIIIKKED